MSYYDDYTDDDALQDCIAQPHIDYCICHESAPLGICAYSCNYNKCWNEECHFEMHECECGARWSVA